MVRVGVQAPRLKGHVVADMTDQAGIEAIVATDKRVSWDRRRRDTPGHGRLAERNSSLARRGNGRSSLYAVKTFQLRRLTS